jgi:hypothetical protein
MFPTHTLVRKSGKLPGEPLKRSFSEGGIMLFLKLSAEGFKPQFARLVNE